MRRTLFLLLCFVSSSVMMTAGVSALTIDDIIKLKKAGVSDETIQMLINQEQERSLEAKKPSAESNKTMGTWEVKDPDGRQATIYTTGVGQDPGEEDPGNVEEENRRRAWEMLNNMVIDAR